LFDSDIGIFVPNLADSPLDIGGPTNTPLRSTN
jgi:hypothetical protein